MEQMAAIYKYCITEQVCYPCFKDDQQDPVKLYFGLCHLCDRERWNSIKSYISIDYLITHMNKAPKEWVLLYQDELKRRS